jgi:cob(I)alamin adenosyltransferase
MATNLHRGDGGDTRLASGQRVRKDDWRIECVGSVDELSSFLGLARAALTAAPYPKPEALALSAGLARIQRELYLLGAQLAKRDDAGRAVASARIAAEHVLTLDDEIEQLDARLPTLRGFILPGGGLAAAHLHVARAICRRAEREAVRLASAEATGDQVLPYLNRLSLALFSMARQAAFLSGAQDEHA